MAALASQTAYAQSQDANDQESEVERISVIGSNIQRATDVGALPVTALNEKDIEDMAAATGDDLLRAIPQIGEDREDHSARRLLVLPIDLGHKVLCPCSGRSLIPIALVPYLHPQACSLHPPL